MGKIFQGHASNNVSNLKKKVIASWASYLKDYYQGFMENTIAMFPSITLREGESNIATLSLTNRIATLCRSCLTALFLTP